MLLFYFRNEIYQTVITSTDFSEAMKTFEKVVQSFYGKTLEKIEKSSDLCVGVYWREEGENQTIKDIYQVTMLSGVAVSWLNNASSKPEILVVQPEAKKAMCH